MKSAKPTSFFKLSFHFLSFYDSQCIREATKSAEFLELIELLKITAKIKLDPIKIWA